MDAFPKTWCLDTIKMMSHVAVCCKIVRGDIFFPLLIAEHMGVMEALPVWAVFIIFLIPYGIIGYDVLRKACVNISKVPASEPH